MSKNQLESFVEYGRLFEIYGKLLSEERQTIMTNYFQYNMTLAEIADERKISRQAVLDSINKSCEKLKKIETSLQILKQKQNLAKSLQELEVLAKNHPEIIEKVEKILKEL